MEARAAALLLALLSAACATAPAPAAKDDPSKEEVPLRAAPGWHADLVLENDVGVWTVETFPIFPEYGMPGIVGLDDRGRCILLSCF